MYLIIFDGRKIGLHNETHLYDEFKKKIKLGFETDITYITWKKTQIQITLGAVKIFLNTFYAIKVQYFTELYLASQKFNIDFDEIRELMLHNGWINPAHTQVPGPDGQISYGGACFTKDTQALLGQLVRYNSPHAVLEASVKERTLMRTDEINVSPTLIKRSAP